MKKLLILLMIFTLFLSGCYIYNLSGFTLPDDEEFLAVIQELDTPEKTCQYMEDNFTYRLSPYISSTPYQMYISKIGDCNDYATFAQFVANYHGYKTYLIKIIYSNYKFPHVIAIYNFSGYLHFSDNQSYVSTGYSDFEDIVKIDTLLFQYTHIWSSYTVYDYDMKVVEKGINN